jgi:hypothetical protein
MEKKYYANASSPLNNISTLFWNFNYNKVISESKWIESTPNFKIMINY